MPPGAAAERQAPEALSVFTLYLSLGLCDDLALRDQYEIEAGLGCSVVPSERLSK